MASVNKVILVGNLGRDPETRYTTGGEAVTNVSIATTDSWKDKAGEKQERTEWHRVAFFGKLAEIAGEYLKKGSQVYVEGRLQTRKWQDKEGQEKYTTEIIADRMQMLGSRAGGGGGGGEPPERERSAGGGKPAGSAPAKKNVDDLDESIGFYSRLFGTEPAKIRPGYANFAVADPPLKLVLVETPGQGGSINHLGVEVEDVDTVDAIQARLAADGLASVDERGTTCCYAKQDKFWVEGTPHGEMWEVYTVLEDSPVYGIDDSPTSRDAGMAELNAPATTVAAACC